MFLGVPRHMYLTRARDSFLLDCKAASFDSQIIQGYRDILNSFIAYTGDILVRELLPDDLRLYIADLADVCEIGQLELVEEHYGVLSEWIHWMYIQKEITEPISERIKPPRPPARRFLHLYIDDRTYVPL